MPLTVRRATEEDVRALAALASELGYPTDTAQMAERLPPVLREPSHAVFVVEDDRVAGYLHLALQYSLEEGLHAEILALLVTASRRGLGLGARLLATAEEWAQSQGLPLIRVRSNVVRERTHAFYKKKGYRESKQQKLFVKRLRPA